MSSVYDDTDWKRSAHALAKPVSGGESDSMKSSLRLEDQGTTLPALARGQQTAETYRHQQESPLVISQQFLEFNEAVPHSTINASSHKASAHGQKWPGPVSLELSGQRSAIYDKYHKQMENMMHSTFRNNQENVFRKIN